MQTDENNYVTLIQQSSCTVCDTKSTYTEFWRRISFY